MHCIGNSVGDLRVTFYFSQSHLTFYQPIIDKIIAEKRRCIFSSVFPIPRFVSLSLPGRCAKTFFDEFLPQFSSSLKHVSISCYCMTPTFRDTFDLDSLTILGFFDDGFILCCCKNVSLEFNYTRFSSQNFQKFILENRQSHGLSSVTRLTFDVFCFGEVSGISFKRIFKCFPSLEFIKFGVPLKWRNEFSDCINFFIKVINGNIKVPAKIAIEFCKCNKYMKFWKLDTCKRICSDFVFDETVSNFYYFRKIVQSAGSESAILEVQIPK